MLPSTMLLRGVRCYETDSRGVGAFSDVFYGFMVYMPVAIKKLRTYTAATETRKLEMKRVGSSIN